MPSWLHHQYVSTQMEGNEFAGSFNEEMISLGAITFLTGSSNGYTDHAVSNNNTQSNQRAGVTWSQQ